VKESQQEKKEGTAQREVTSNCYAKSVVPIPMPEATTNIAAGENFGFAWNRQNLFVWGMGIGYVLLTGEENDVEIPYLVKGKITNNHRIHQLDAGSQHVLYTSYP
jgi:alpha-tubulin suppressor-like RCC1 family protein